MKNKKVIFISALTIVLFSLYFRGLRSELIWDDKIFFGGNLLLSENRPLSEAFKVGYFSEQIGMKDSDHYYRPLLTLSFMVEDRLWGISPAGLRIVNLLIYFGALVFLYFFFRLASDRGHLPEIATLLFALHPLNVDNIIWIVGRSDLLLLLWVVLVLLFLEKYLERGKSLDWVMASFFFLLGVFSKESFIFIWPALIFYERIKHKKITIPFHLLNLLSIMAFFAVKNVVLGIKNLDFLLPKDILFGATVLLKTLGFYVKSIFWPFAAPFFISPDNVQKVRYLVVGILFTALFILLLYFSRKQRETRFPLILAACFLGGHLPLVFSKIYPYSIYPRYMMISSLGLIWTLSIYLRKIPEKIRLSLVFLIILSLIPTVVLRIDAYRTEENFWSKASRKFSNDGYVLVQISKVLQENGDFIRAEFFLNKSLSLNLQRETAILVSVSYAEVEMAKADYENVFRWMESLEEVEGLYRMRLATGIRYEINKIKSRVWISQGEIPSAEKCLQENIETFPQAKDSFFELFEMYVGYGMWEKAKALADRIRLLFPSFAQDPEKIARELESMPLDDKIAFYTLRRNFSKATALIETIAAPDLMHRILLAKLAYKQGEGERGQTVIEAIAAEDSESYETMNTIAAFYLNDLFRVREALVYMKKSLELNPDQPKIRFLIINLTKNYLEQLTEVWK